MVSSAATLLVGHVCNYEFSRGSIKEKSYNIVVFLKLKQNFVILSFIVMIWLG